MEDIRAINGTNDYYTYEGTFIYKGHMINLFLDDYGQTYFIQYEDNGKLVEECCGSYCDWKGFVEYRFRDKEHNMSWRDDPVTKKQLDLINEMMEMSERYIPKFTGKTKGEASDYINKYAATAFERIIPNEDSLMDFD